MKRLGLMLACSMMIASGGAAASNWVLSSTDDDPPSRSYVDTDNLKRKGNRVKTWLKTVYSSTQHKYLRTTGEPMTFDQIISLVDYDCEEKTVSIRQASWSLQGRYVGSEQLPANTVHVEPDSEDTLNFVCRWTAPAKPKKKSK